MPTMTIKSKSNGTIVFFMPDGGGYVRLTSSKKPGTLGAQICKGGNYMGSTLSATVASFATVCRKWHAQRLAAILPYDGEY